MVIISPKLPMISQTHSRIVLLHCCQIVQALDARVTARLGGRIEFPDVVPGSMPQTLMADPDGIQETDVWFLCNLGCCGV
jgi:hypothetical protein